jgi:hypothetical protein
LHRLVTAGLTASAAAWPALQIAYGWVHRAAHLLANAAGLDLLDLRRAYRTLLAEMARGRAALGDLAPAVSHFLKVTRSYWLGLFACERVPDLPRTNNDLEQFFGAARYHERRASGRKVASPTLVVRGRVRVVATVATQHQHFTSEQLAPADLKVWRTLRQDLEQRQQSRCHQSRFRKDPAAYLAEAEALLQQTLPP